MYNLIVLASRPDDWTHDQFIEWWRGEHAEVTYPLPGLLRWQHTELLDSFDPKSSGWDGLSVLSFDSRQALDAALSSQEWKESTLPGANGRFVRRSILSCPAEKSAMMSLPMCLANTNWSAPAPPFRISSCTVETITSLPEVADVEGSVVPLN